MRCLEAKPIGTKFHILSPIAFVDNIEISLSKVSKVVLDSGYVRFQIGTEIYSVGDVLPERILSSEEKPYIVIDRLVSKEDQEFRIRLKDSLRVAYDQGN